jgi:hypothetical protein
LADDCLVAGYFYLFMSSSLAYYGAVRLEL